MADESNRDCYPLAFSDSIINIQKKLEWTESQPNFIVDNAFLVRERLAEGDTIILPGSP